MSGIVEVDGGWLALREPEDARARSRELALAAAALLGPGPLVVHDLGSGTGAMARWLAPLLPGPQTWVLHDWNPGLLGRAGALGLPVDRDGRTVGLGTRTGGLARLDPGELAGASLVTASALLDVLTETELDALARACIAAGAPVLLSLSVTGEVRLDPPDPLDEAVRAAFNAHQRRRRHGRRLLGPEAAEAARQRFAEAGWRVRAARTEWRLDDRGPRLLAEWFGGWLDAALEQHPELAAPGADAADRYRARRAEQSRRGALSALVAHTDLLAWP